jgi:tetratricopeptide (TPR) repeat protein
MAHCSLGSIYLNEGRISQALPLLAQSATAEKKSRRSAKAHKILVEAHLEGLKKGVEGASRAGALRALDSLQAYADTLPQGAAAAAWHGAGKLYQHLGIREKALESLKKASELQPDDWVDLGGGRRYKHRGISSAYQKDYSGAQMEQGP